VTWTDKDHRSVENVTIGVATIAGDTEAAPYEELLAKGVIKVSKAADIKVERKPEMLGY
jgi:hypothetical protein